MDTWQFSIGIRNGQEMCTCTRASRGEGESHSDLNYFETRSGILFSLKICIFW